MSEDPRVKAAARALAEYDGQNPDAGVPNVDLTADPLWLRYEPRAYAALAAADAAAWSPIEEAPKDGTEILTWGTLHEDQICETHHLQVSWWDDRGVWNSHLWGSHAPTHFRYITPPQEQDT